MSGHRHGATCRREKCRRRRAEHLGTGLRCPGEDMDGATFQGHVPRGGASNSFAPGEIRLLDELFQGLLRGGDVRILIRSPHFTSLARKAKTMKLAAERRRKAKDENGTT